MKWLLLVLIIGSFGALPLAQEMPMDSPPVENEIPAPSPDPIKCRVINGEVQCVHGDAPFPDPTPLD